MQAEVFEGNFDIKEVIKLYKRADLNLTPPQAIEAILIGKNKSWTMFDIKVIVRQVKYN